MKTYYDLIGQLSNDVSFRNNRAKDIGDLIIEISPEPDGSTRVSILQKWRPVKNLDAEFNNLHHTRFFFHDGKKKELVSMKSDRREILSKLEKRNIVFLGTSNYSSAYLIDKRGTLCKKTECINYFLTPKKTMNYLRLELLERFMDPNFPISDLSQKRKIYGITGRELRRYLPEELSNLILEYRFK